MATTNADLQHYPLNMWGLLRGRYEDELVAALFYVFTAVLIRVLLYGFRFVWKSDTANNRDTLASAVFAVLTWPLFLTVFQVLSAADQLHSVSYTAQSFLALLAVYYLALAPVSLFLGALNAAIFLFSARNISNLKFFLSIVASMALQIAYLNQFKQW